MRRIIFFAFFLCSYGAYAGGKGQWTTHPAEDVTYRFYVDTGEKDRWDSSKQEEPPLAPGKAARVAKEFVTKVPMWRGMKEWSLRKITLEQLSPAPNEEWVYIIQFGGVLSELATWDGHLPLIDIPVRMDGTIPKPLIQGSREVLTK